MWATAEGATQTLAKRLTLLLGSLAAAASVSIPLTIPNHPRPAAVAVDASVSADAVAETRLWRQESVRAAAKLVARARQTAPRATTTTTTVRRPVVRAQQRTVPAPAVGLYEAWSRVAVCEEGGFGHYGFPAYPDSLGINRTNWYRFGGGSDLSPSAQIAVAMRLIAYYHAPIPDQHGCAAW